jgi:cell division protein YceG involved in septum cleavage
MDNEERLVIKPAEAARMLSRDRSAVYNLCYTGEIESVKIGRYRYIFRDSVIAYVNRLRELGQQQREQETWPEGAKMRVVSTDEKTGLG